jgi:hypothetical protein
MRHPRNQRLKKLRVFVAEIPATKNPTAKNPAEKNPSIKTRRVPLVFEKII